MPETVKKFTMQIPPIDVILSWPTSNYDDPQDVRGFGLLIVTCVVYPITVLMVGLRIFTRLRISRSFGIEDVFLLPAQFLTTACAVLTCLAVDWGWNRHI